MTVGNLAFGEGRPGYGDRKLGKEEREAGKVEDLGEGYITSQ